MKFANAANKYSNFTRTENNAVALKTTGSALLDLFARAGALRQLDSEETAKIFSKAFVEDKLLATKALFYIRNIRGGLGERKVFRDILHDFAITHPDIVIKNIPIIPLFGRFDDLYALVGTGAEVPMWDFVRKTLIVDLENMGKKQAVSLAAKWLKSINTSSKNSCVLGIETAKHVGVSPKTYRKMLSGLRSYIELTEKKMSSNEWEDIKYSAVPSGSMKKNRKAFWKHDAERFGEFINKVEKGEEKINSSTLYPYDILLAAGLKTPGMGYYLNPRSISKTFTMNHDPVLEAQWKALPNYVEGENNVLVMSDTSGSMEGLPMATSIGLAIYFAERNKGAYKDLFLTFSEEPAFVRLVGDTLAEKVNCIESIIANTNLEAAFDLILDVALNNNVSPEEMPKTLIIISDMQFDSAVSSYQRRFASETFHTSMEKKFAAHGYTMPVIVYWNVEERTKGTFQVEKDKEGVILVSGHSASTFKSVISNIGKTPYDFMVECLSNPIYDVVKI